MSSPQELPGLERLMKKCRHLKLRMETAAPGHSPPQPGALVAGLPFDPVLAAVYARVGFAAFATDVVGIVLRRYDDSARTVEEDNGWWSQGYRKQLALPTFIFAGEPHLACRFATVPSLADTQGQQPVVWVDVYEEPYAMPVASTVDRFFDTYSRYLESLMALPNAREEGGSLLTFPWNASDIVGRDRPLVEAIRKGLFNPLMPGTDEQAWARKVLDSSTS